MGLGAMRRGLDGVAGGWACLAIPPRMCPEDLGWGWGGMVWGVFRVVMGFLIVREIIRNGCKLLKIKGRGGF